MAKATADDDVLLVAAGWTSRGPRGSDAIVKLKSKSHGVSEALILEVRNNTFAGYKKELRSSALDFPNAWTFAGEDRAAARMAAMTAAHRQLRKAMGWDGAL